MPVAVQVVIAVVSLLVGLATLAGVVYRLGKVGQELKGAVTGTEERLAARVDGVHEKLSDRVDGVEERLDGSITMLELKLRGNDAVLQARLDAIDHRQKDVNVTVEHVRRTTERHGQEIARLAVAYDLTNGMATQRGHDEGAQADERT